MVRQPMVSVVARLAKALTDDSKNGMLLAGNAVLGHGRAARLSVVSVANLNSVSVGDKLSPAADPECVPSTILLLSTRWLSNFSKLPAEGLVKQQLYELIQGNENLTLPNKT